MSSAVPALLIAVVILAFPRPAASTLYCREPMAPMRIGGFYDQYSAEMAELDVRGYLDDVDTYIKCLTKEIKDTQDEAQQAIDQYNRAVQIYNMQLQ